MHKIVKLIGILVFVFVLSGCSDAAEPDSLGYVVAIGIDTPEEGNSKFDITLQFVNPVKISGGASEEGGEGGVETINNITVSATGIYTAVNLANHIISKVFTLSHTKLIVFSEDIAKTGLEDILETIGRSGDIRPNTYFAISKGRAKDFLESVKPKTEVNPVRYYTMLFENDYSGFIPHNLSQDFYFFSFSDEKSTVLPLCAVSEKKGTYNPANMGYQYLLENYTAGEIPSEKKEIQLMGMAIFDNDKMVGEMGDIETEIYNLLSSQYKSGYASYYYSRTPGEPVTVLQHQNKKPKISVDTHGQSPKISLTLYIEADFYSSTPSISVEDHLDEFTKEASAELKSQIESFLGKTQQMGTDIVGFGSYAKRNFKDVKDFSDYKWKEKYPDAVIEVNVDFSVRRTGLVVRSDKK